jgi:hypothetical protein
VEEMLDNLKASFLGAIESANSSRLISVRGDLWAGMEFLEFPAMISTCLALRSRIGFSSIPNGTLRSKGVRRTLAFSHPTFKRVWTHEEIS